MARLPRGWSPLGGITVTTNAADVAKKLAMLGRDQLPFAAAVTLTRTAQRHIERQRRRVLRAFKVRSKGLPKRIRLAAAADKRDWPNPRAIVAYGTKGQDDFWKIQELGGTKRPQGGGRLAIPLKIAGRKRKQSGAIKAQFKPRRLVASKGGFEAVEEKTIRARVGLGHKGGEQRAFRWYFLRPTARVKESKLHARKEAASLRATYMPRVFVREMEAAMRSARMRSTSFSSEMGRALYLVARAKG